MAHSWMSCMRKIFDLDEQEETATNHGMTGVVYEARKMSHAMKPARPLTRVLQPAYTRRLKPEPEDALRGAEQRIAAPLLFTWHGVTDIGKVRQQNEDSFSCLASGSWSLFVVADGMGGHDAGEVASRIAVETVCREISERANRNDDPTNLVERAVQQANREVKQEAMNRGSNMGTTLSLAFMTNNTAYIANVGDSRVYRIENGSINQITEDHSLVARLAAAGKLTKAEARGHPKSNLLYRTIGTDDTIKVDTFRMELKKGDNFLLCTDGLWGMLTDEELHQVCIAEKDAQSAGAKLVQMANDHGGNDNITAVVVKAL